MSEFKLVVTKIDPHPKAGERLPYDGVREYRQYGSVPDTYPDTVESRVLEVVLSKGEFAAAMRSVLEAGVRDAL